MARVVFGTLTVLAAVVVIRGCAVTGGAKSSSRSPRNVRRSVSRGTRELDAPALATECGLGLLLRSRDTKEVQKDTQVEYTFRKIDANGNDMIDATEWVDFSKCTSVWDFVQLLDYADTDDDETISLEELLSVQVVKIDQSEEEKDDIRMTS